MAAGGQPTWLVVVLAVIAALASGGGIVAFYGSRVTLRLGIRADERQARADELTAEDRMIARLERDRDHEHALRVHAEHERDAQLDYVEELRRHIWDGKPWPPPPRPSTTPPPREEPTP